MTMTETPAVVPTFEGVTDEELRLIVKSLSITYDSLQRKLSRLHGNTRREALEEFETCDAALAKARRAQTQRQTRR